MAGDRQVVTREPRELPDQADAARSVLETRRKRLRLLSVVGVLAVLGISLFVALHGASDTPATPVAAWLGPPSQDVPSPPTGQFQRAGLQSHTGSTPKLVFIGAQYSPFAAAERWAVVKALGQLGSFSGLRSGLSQSGQSGLQAIPTFDLLHARYRSAYVLFDHKDLEDRAGHRLQRLSARESRLLASYDPSGTIPLVLIGDYAMAGSGYPPRDIEGKSFETIQKALQHTVVEGYVQEINAEANVITALLCHTGGGLPRAVCARAAVQRISRQLQ